MLRMRLRRTGAKKQPRYRIVIMESQSKRDGAFVDWLGFYDPLTNPPTVRVNEERVRHWLGEGVSMSDTVRGLLHRNGVEGVEPDARRSAGSTATATAPKEKVRDAAPAAEAPSPEPEAAVTEPEAAVAEPEAAAAEPEAAAAEPEAAVAEQDASQDAPEEAVVEQAESGEAEAAGPRRSRTRKQE